jgi:uncharacterized damage-inducible protein DinB
MLPGMLNLTVAAAVLTTLAVPAAALAQDAAKPAPPPITAAAGLKNLHTQVRGFLIRAAEAMPEENYSFKPTPDVRSFGELIGHLANTNYTFCAGPRKVASPNKDNIEKTATTKAALVAALKEAFAFCDPAYEMADAGLTEMVKFGPRDVAAGYSLTFNVAHNNEHYGNIVTYMRLKGMVPPSSEPRR